MGVGISQGKRIPIESSTLVASHDWNVYSNDAGRIRDERQIEKIQPQNVQHKGTIRSADPIINDDRADNHLLRTFCADMSNRLGNDALERFQLPNAVVQQPQMDFGTVSGTNTLDEMGFGVQQTNQAGPTIEQLQLQNQQLQNQMILELQKQMGGLLEIHLQQQQRRLSSEEAMRRMQENIAQKSAVEEVESMRIEPGIDEIGIVPMDKLPELEAGVSKKVNSLDPRAVRLILRRTEGSKIPIDAKPIRQLRKLSQYPDETNGGGKVDGSLRKKKREKQVRSNVRVQMCNDAAHKNFSAYVRQNSTLHSCKECGKEFTQKGSLNRHLRIHTGEKPFKCWECDKAFTQSNTLKDHQRIHTAAKPFKCHHCEAAFGHKTALSCHLLIHTTDKPFLCDICSRCFRRKCILSEHMKIHSGLKPWKCNMCQKLFRHKSTLNRHRKRLSHDED